MASHPQRGRPHSAERTTALADALRPPADPPRRPWLQPVGAFLLFCAAVILVLLDLDPSLHLQVRTPSFHPEWSNSGVWGRPGGPLEAAADFLSQWFSSLWGAVLIHGVVTAAVALGAAGFFKGLTGRSSLFLGLSVAVPVLALCGRYGDPVLSTSLGLALTLVFLAAYTNGARGGRFLGWIFLPLILVGLTYLIAGGFALLLALLAMVFELRARPRRWVAAGSWVMSAAALPLLLRPWHGQTRAAETYLASLWPYPWPMSGLIYGGAFFIALGWVLLPSNGGQIGTFTVRWPCRGAKGPGIGLWLKLVLVLGLVLGADLLVRDPPTRALLRVSDNARRQNWAGVLAQVPDLKIETSSTRGLPPPLLSAYVDIQRALYHRGQLQEGLFSLSRPVGTPLLPSSGQVQAWCIPLSEFFLELGQVNYAEHWAHEALELKGARPEILKTLAVINQLQSRPAAAQIFLRRLARVPGQAAESRRRLAQLESDPLGERNPHLQRLRAVMVTDDQASGYLDLPALLRQALSANPHNRMAYEFLMADHLLNLQFDSAIQLMAQRETVGGSGLPKHCQEAVLLQSQLSQTNASEVASELVSPVMRERFQRFIQEVARLKNDKAKLRAGLAPEYSDSLWFYSIFRETPGQPARFAALSKEAIPSAPAEAVRAVPPPNPVPAANRAVGLQLDPDYAGLVIPPNIAPLNFVIVAPHGRCQVRMRGANGSLLEVESQAQRVEWPAKLWQAFLEANRGQAISLEFSRPDPQNRWEVVETLTNQVASEEIDGWLVYRLLGPLYNRYVDVGIFQRNLSTFEQRTVLHNRSFNQGCVNCHTFREQRPETLALHIRTADGNPMLLGGPEGITRVENTAGYMSWHPSGRWLAYSKNKLSLFFHTTGENRDVYDAHSDLAIYDLVGNTILAPPVLAQPDRMETWPAWSPDGRFLHFCSAPKRSQNRFRDVRYDLKRVAFDPDTVTWGAAETLIDAQALGKSIAQPRPSPDGRLLVFCQFNYGHFPIYQPSSDLAVMDLTADLHVVRDPGINSPVADTWHSWSSNSRWMVFSSKRRDGLLARPHLTHVDEQGRFSKPFVLPQEDPEFYDNFLKTFNVPELVRGPVPYAQAALAKAVNAPDRVVRPQAADIRRSGAAENMAE